MHKHQKLPDYYRPAKRRSLKRQAHRTERHTSKQALRVYTHTLRPEDAHA